MSAFITAAASKPVGPVDAVETVLWRVPQISALALDWRAGRGPKKLQGPKFTLFGVPVDWHVSISRDENGSFSLYLNRTGLWNPALVRFNWAAFGGPKHLSIVALREYQLLAGKPTDNWGKGSLSVEECFGEADKANDSWLITIILQRAPVITPANEILAALANQVDCGPTFDLAILCGDSLDKPNSKGPDAKPSDRSAASATSDGKRPAASALEPSRNAPNQLAAGDACAALEPRRDAPNHHLPSGGACAAAAAVPAGGSAVGDKPHWEAQAQSAAALIKRGTILGQGQGEPDIVWANRFVLALRSPMVHSMFYGAAAGAEQKEGVWNLCPTRRHIVCAMVRFAYGVPQEEWARTISNDADALALFELAMRLQMMDLANASTTLFVTNLADVGVAKHGLLQAKKFLDLLTVDTVDIDTPDAKLGNGKAAPLGGFIVGSQVEAMFRTTYYLSTILSISPGPSGEPRFKVKAEFDGEVAELTRDKVRGVGDVYQSALKCAGPRTLASQQLECAQLVATAARAFLAQNIDRLISDLSS